MTDTLNWTHINFSDSAEADWLLNKSGVEPVFAEAMLESESRPRVLQTEDETLVILRGINLNTGADFEDMISVRVWLGHDRVITASRRPLKSLEHMRQAVADGTGPATPQVFLLDLISRLGNFISEAIDRIEDHLEQAESEVGESAGVARNSPFSVLRRQTARIRRYLAPQREALERLSRNLHSVFNEEDLVELREQLNRLTLMLEDLELARERALVAQEEFLGILAHEQNSRMLLLSVVAAVFLPLSFLTGLMGMNVAGLPGTVNTWAFTFLALFMTLIAGLILLLFRIKKWF